jgi:hypothetical protein
MSRHKAHKAKQLEVNWGMPEAFALAIQTTIDGDRITREQQQREADHKEAEENQLQLN